MSKFDEELASLKSEDTGEWIKARAASLLATRAYHRQLAVVFLEKALLAVLVAVGVQT